jgi:hypothetical protein
MDSVNLTTAQMKIALDRLEVDNKAREHHLGGLWEQLPHGLVAFSYEADSTYSTYIGDKTIVMNRDGEIVHERFQRRVQR